MRLNTVVLVALALPALAGAGGPSGSTAADKPPCESHTPRPDRLNVSCTLAAPDTARRWRFKAHFSGSHDDTTASLTPTLDGKPLVCEAGSKTRLGGDEEGDVSLECRFSIASEAGAQATLKVALAWHHAQYVAFELGAE